MSDNKPMSIKEKLRFKIANTTDEKLKRALKLQLDSMPDEPQDMQKKQDETKRMEYVPTGAKRGNSIKKWFTETVTDIK